MEDRRILTELAPVVEKELNRHLSLSRPWSPFEYIPWSEGQNFPMLGGKEWEESDQKFNEMVRASLIIQLASEDNLPFYMYQFGKVLGYEEAWTEWLNRWTTEESRHGSSIRDYLIVTRSINPYELEKIRMSHMPQGFVMPTPKPIHIMANTAIQELVVRQSYNNTGNKSGDPVLIKLLNRIGLDENLHMIFYRNMVKESLDLCPDISMIAISDTIINYIPPAYKMPGHDYLVAKVAIADIYDLKRHYEKTISPLLRYWNIFYRNDFGPDGELARENLSDFLVALKDKADIFYEKRKKIIERLESNERTGL